MEDDCTKCKYGIVGCTLDINYMLDVCVCLECGEKWEVRKDG